jgi:hypothetical protein
MKKSLLFACLTFTGCTKSMHTVKYAGDDFSHTSSMCLDALLVNMDENNCSYTSMKAGDGILTVHCETKAPEEENFWIDNKFFIVPTTPDADVIGAVPICIDYNFGVYVPIEAESTEGQINE